VDRTERIVWPSHDRKDRKAEKGKLGIKMLEQDSWDRAAKLDSWDRTAGIRCYKMELFKNVQNLSLRRLKLDHL
jgi:hypothetical protein